MEDIKLFTDLIDVASEEDKDLMLKRLYILLVGSNANVTRALSAIDKISNGFETLNNRIDLLNAEAQSIKSELAYLMLRREDKPVLMN